MAKKGVIKKKLKVNSGTKRQKARRASKLKRKIETKETLSGIKIYGSKPIFWVLGLLLISVVGLAIIDVNKGLFDQKDLTGAIAQYEETLTDARLIRCQDRTDCPQDSGCLEGYCVAEEKGSGLISGAVVGINSIVGTPEMVKCETSVDCPGTSFCKQGYCVQSVKGKTLTEMMQEN